MLATMHFAREDCRSDRRIRAYAPGCLTIGEQRYHSSLIVAETFLIETWRPRTSADLKRDDFEPVLAQPPEILLLGTGARLDFPSPALTAHLLERGIGVEVMDTPAACRTFNILLSEQRRVAAALLL